MKRRQAILNEIIQTKYPQTNKQASTTNAIRLYRSMQIFCGSFSCKFQPVCKKIIWEFYKEWKEQQQNKQLSLFDLKTPNNQQKFEFSDVWKQKINTGHAVIVFRWKCWMCKPCNVIKRWLHTYRHSNRIDSDWMYANAKWIAILWLQLFQFVPLFFNLSIC